jgi:ABC-type ATPase with predicted acetyltransferase domain
MQVIAIGAAPSSPRLRMACARFGLRLTHEDPHPPRHAAALARVVATPPGSITLITGRSGSGKSVLLHDLERECRRRQQTAIRVAPPASHVRLIDAIGGTLTAALATLAAVGLADATILPRFVRDLSEGEKARLALAVAIRAARVRRASWLLLDEFLAVVDRPTARGVATGIRRTWNRDDMPRLVVATSHDDLAAALRPDCTINLDDASEVTP